MVEKESKAHALRRMREANYEAKSSRGKHGESTSMRLARPSAIIGTDAAQPPSPMTEKAGVAPGPREAKLGRPRLEEKRPASSKPWLAVGMSRASWYRRQKKPQ